MTAHARAFVAVVCAASAVRFSGLGYSVPFHFHIDEQLLMVSTVSLIERPKEAVREKYFFNYGSFPRLLAGGPLLAARLAGRLDLTRERQVRAYYLVARGVSALVGTLTVAIVGIVGTWLLGPWEGVIPALLLAFSPLHLRDSHFFTPDPLLTSLVTAALACALWAERTGGVKAMAGCGVTAGLALATKLSALPALAPVALVWWRRREGRTPLALGLLAAFVAGNWPVLLAPDAFAQSLRTLLSWARGGTVRQADLQFVETAPWLYWVTNLLRYGAGPVLWVCGLAGVGLLAVRGRPGRLVLAAGVPYFLVMGAGFQKFMRFSLPVHPVLALGGGLLLATLWGGRGLSRALVGALLAIHVLVGLAYAGVFLREDPRIRAGRELARELPPGTRVLLETTHSNPPLIEEDYRKGLFGSYLPRLGLPLVRRCGEFELLYLDPYVYLYEVVREPQAQWACILEALDEADVVIVGNRYRDQYARLPHRFPAMARFYRELDGGALGFACVRVYRNPARLGPLEIDDARAELTFRLFDRPTLWVYVRPGTAAWRALCASGGS